MAKRVVHLVNGLGLGGAQTMIYQILKYKSDNDIEYTVVSLGENFFYETLIKKLGVQVLNVSFRKNPVLAIVKIIKIIKDKDTLCCWMYHSNLIGYITGKLAGVNRIVWCIRHGNLDRDKNSLTTLIINRICSKLSKNVDIIAYNGMVAKSIHENIGYKREKGIILNNGVDCEQYVPFIKVGSIKCDLGIGKQKKIILSVSRNHPIKDLPCFIKAFSHLHMINPNVVALMCGMGIDSNNANLVEICKQEGLKIGENIYLLGMRNDVEKLMATCDLYVLHSAGEAFPNALIQAMSCGCLCITTDVGDARTIINDEELVVMPGNYDLLGKKMVWALSLSKGEIDKKRYQARKRIKEHYNIHNIVREYENVF